MQLAFKLSDVRKIYVLARITLKNRFFSLHLNNQMVLAQLFVMAKKETKFFLYKTADIGITCLNVQLLYKVIMGICG